MKALFIFTLVFLLGCSIHRPQRAQVRHTELFDHLNSPDEPSTFKRSTWRQNMNPVFIFLRFFYLRYKWLKCTWQLKFKHFGL